MSMIRSKMCAVSLAVVAAMTTGCGAAAQDHLKVAVGARGVGETFVAGAGTGRRNLQEARPHP